mgnify:FL=1
MCSATAIGLGLLAGGVGLAVAAIAVTFAWAVFG